MILIAGKKPLVYLDPGHGGNDSGALGPNGEKESELALSIAKELRYQLELKGIDSFLTREKDENLELSKRCSLANESKCLLFLSIHCNSVNSPTPEGIETIYSASSGRGKALANYVQQAMLKYCGENKKHKDRGMKASPSMSYQRTLYVLTQTKMPATLVECEFISHPEQVKWLAGETGQKQIAYALSEGILSYLKSLENCYFKDTETKFSPLPEDNIQIQTNQPKYSSGKKQNKSLRVQKQ